MSFFFFLAIALNVHAETAKNAECARQQIVKVTLERRLEKPCAQITGEDLTKVLSLDLYDPQDEGGELALKRQDFEGLENVKQLSVRHDGTRAKPATCLWDDDAFSPLKKLETLSLSCGLKSLPPNKLRGLEQLKSIGFGGNELEGVLAKDFFLGLPNLETIDLDNNSGASLDESIFVDLPKLKSMMLDRTKLKSRPECFNDASGGASVEDSYSSLMMSKIYDGKIDGKRLQLFTFYTLVSGGGDHSEKCFYYKVIDGDKAASYPVKGVTLGDTYEDPKVTLTKKTLTVQYANSAGGYGAPARHQKCENVLKWNSKTKSFDAPKEKCARWK